MENKKNKTLGLSIIAIFISILSIFISILKFNGTNQNNNYLLNGQQTHETVLIDPIKYNKVIADNEELVKYSKSIFINKDYEFIINIASVANNEFSSTYFELNFNDYYNNNFYTLSDIEYYYGALSYYNDINIEFTLEQVDNLEFYIYYSITFLTFQVDNSNVMVEDEINFDLPLSFYQYLSDNNLYQLNYTFDNETFYFAHFFNDSDYNSTFFDNISLIATKVGAILVATLSPITTLLFSNGKLTIVGASLAMALGVGAIYLIFRMVRGLIKHNERG